MSVESISLWHKRARPSPKWEDFEVQLGCHIEEFIEQMDALFLPDVSDRATMGAALDTLEMLAMRLKQGTLDIRINDRENLLKELCDGVVTAIGVAHCAGMDSVSGLAEVSRSNWSKFDKDGYPTFDKNGKIKKGDNYSPADMKGMV